MSFQRNIVKKVQALLAVDVIDLDPIIQQVHALGIAAVPPLIDALLIPETRVIAMHSLRQFGNDAAAAVPIAISLLTHPDPNDSAASAAANLLTAIGAPAVAPLIGLMATADGFEYERSRDALFHMEPNVVIPQLVASLTSDNPLIRRAVCHLLWEIPYSGNIGDCDPSKDLILRISDSDPGVRQSAAKALSNFATFEVIRDAFNAGDAATRIGCLTALIQSRFEHEVGRLEFVRAALSDVNSFVRIAAADGLMRISMELCMQTSREVIREEDPELKIAVMRSRRTQVNNGVELKRRYRDDIFSLLRHENVAVRREAATTLVRMSFGRDHDFRRRLLKVLDEALRDDLDTNRPEYLDSLGQPGCVEKMLIPAVVTCLRSDDRITAIAAARTLGRIGSENQDAVTELTAIVRTHDVGLQQAAIRALSDLGSKAASALPDLLEILRRGEHTYEVLDALKQMGSAAAPAISDVASLIGERYEHPPFVLAAIGNREAILELARAVSTYGNGDRKDYEASVDALWSIADYALPVLEAEFLRAQPGEYVALLDGLATILEPHQVLTYQLKAIELGDFWDQFIAISMLLNFIESSPENCQTLVLTPGAVDRLLNALTSSNVDVRTRTLEVFEKLRTDSPTVVDFYRDQLVNCLRQTVPDIYREEALEDLRKTAEGLGISLTQFDR